MANSPDGVTALLRAKLPGLAPPADAPYGMRQLYLSDPDGYALCFQARLAQAPRGGG